MKITITGATSALLCLCSTVAFAQGLELGESPGPLELQTLQGRDFAMNNYSERPGTAILFLSGRCATTDKAISDINKLYRKYRLRNLLYVGVCSNADETGAELRTFAQHRGVIFPIYRDASKDVARRFAAHATPEIFLLDRTGALVFHGGLDTEDGRTALESAVVSVLKKEPVTIASRAVRGTPINQPGPEREVDNLYGRLSFSSELVFEQIADAPAHHCSTLCEAANGDLLCLWYGGSYESADDQVLFLSRRVAGERSWTEPQVLVQGFPQPPGNGVIFRDTRDQLWVVWARMESTRPIRRGSGWGRCQLMYRISNDHGQSWSEDRRLFDETLWSVPRNPPVTLSDGTLLLPVEGSLEGVEGSHFLSLGPGAEGWQRAGFTSGGSQPAVIERGDGTLLALMRHSRFITQIESRDGGRTWTGAASTELKNPNAGISMTKLANDHVVLVFNDSQTRRTPLSIARSLDDGKTWEQPLQLESNPGEYSYPCVIQTADGKIHISYTYRRYAIKHVELNEDWLVHLSRPN